jgi:hypothetical protein
VASGGLVFENADDAYDRLLGKKDGTARVIPGNVACSLLIERLYATDPDLRMPKGDTPLLDGELCNVRQWIAAGAKR